MAEGLYTSFSVSGPVWVPAERGCKAAVVRSAAADEGSVVIGGGSGDGVCARAVQCVCVVGGCYIIVQRVVPLLALLMGRH